MKVIGDGSGVVNHAGTRLVADLASVLGVDAGLSEAMASTKQRCRGHDRGEVLCDMAIAIADGSKTISDLATLRDQPELFGPVASHATTWRALKAVDETVLEMVKAARAQARKRAWEAGVDPGFYVIDIDATLLNAHSDKENAKPTWKKGFGFHPLMAYLDATGEALAGLVRPGNAASSTVEDHETVLDDALAQLPIDPTDADTEVIVRTDSAGWSHGFVDHCRERNVKFVIGHALTAEIARICVKVPKRRWQNAVTPDGTEERETGEICEITDLASHLFDTNRPWPAGLRIIARRERPHPGAQLTFTDLDGHRYQIFVTDLTDPDIAYLEALHRGRGRAEQQIANTKDTGLTNLPSHSFAINAAWVQLCLIAHDLLAWCRLLTLEGELATAQPKRLRYCLFHVAARLTRTARQTSCRLSPNWPWTQHLLNAFDKLHTLRATT